MQTETGCTSVFQNNEAEPEKEVYTLAWIRLINAMERAKAATDGA